MAALPFSHAFSRRFIWAGYLIGFAAGGFFDGILLHQILQWHHLLSAYEESGFTDLRVQVLADGLFHLSMYAVAAAGLWMLYRSRGEFTGARADRILVADVLIGFGTWHALDAVLSHWLLGLHRIRMDVPDPLAWDIAWLLLFGLIPLLAGLRMKRRYPRATSIHDRRSSRNGIAISLAILVIFAGLLAARPPAGALDGTTVAVVLRPDVRAGAFLTALPRDEARILWGDSRGGVWLLSVPDLRARLHLYAMGALYVSGSLGPGGCAQWLAAGAGRRTLPRA